MLSRPMNMRVFAQSEEEVEFLGEEVIVVFELEAEEREGFDEGAAAGDNFGAAIGDEVQGGELLKDADGVCGAEDCDGAAEADPGCARGCCREDDCWGGVEVLAAVVLAEAEDVEAGFVGGCDLLQQLGDSLLGSYGRACYRVGDRCCKTIYSDLHSFLLGALMKLNAFPGRRFFCVFFWRW